MLQVTEDKIEFSYDFKDPFIKACVELFPDQVEKIVVKADLHFVFEAISEKYGIAECADIVHQAMELTADNYKKDA